MVVFFRFSGGVAAVNIIFNICLSQLDSVQPVVGYTKGRNKSHKVLALFHLMASFLDGEWCCMQTETSSNVLFILESQIPQGLVVLSDSSQSYCNTDKIQVF